MIADEFEVRPPAVEALRWTPGDIATVGRIVVWLEWRGADAVASGGLASQVELTIRKIPGDTSKGRLVARPGDWVVYDTTSSTFDVMGDDEFTEHYRKRGTTT